MAFSCRAAISWHALPNISCRPGCRREASLLSRCTGSKCDLVTFRATWQGTADFYCISAHTWSLPKEKGLPSARLVLNSPVTAFF